MHRSHRLSPAFLCALCASVVNPAAATLADAQALPRVVVQTEVGNIELEIDTIHAPITGANFLRYIDLGFYRFGRFYRKDYTFKFRVKVAREQGWPYRAPVSSRTRKVTVKAHRR